MKRRIGWVWGGGRERGVTERLGKKQNNHKASMNMMEKERMGHMMMMMMMMMGHMTVSAHSPDRTS